MATIPQIAFGHFGIYPLLHIPSYIYMYIYVYIYVYIYIYIKKKKHYYSKSHHTALAP